MCKNHYSRHHKKRICPGCGQGPKNCDRRGGVCDPCYKRGIGAPVLYRGPCVNGCGRPGRGRSKLCRPCSDRFWRRTILLRKLVHAKLDITTLCEVLNGGDAAAPILAEAVATARAVFTGLRDGQLVLSRNTRTVAHIRHLHPARQA